MSAQATQSSGQSRIGSPLRGNQRGSVCPSPPTVVAAVPHLKMSKVAVRLTAIGQISGTNISGYFCLVEDLIPTPMKSRARFSHKQTGESIPSFERSHTGMRQLAQNETKAGCRRKHPLRQRAPPCPRLFVFIVSTHSRVNKMTLANSRRALDCCQ